MSYSLDGLGFNAIVQCQGVKAEAVIKNHLTTEFDLKPKLFCFTKSQTVFLRCFVNFDFCFILTNKLYVCNLVVTSLPEFKEFSVTLRAFCDHAVILTSAVFLTCYKDE